MITVMKDWPLTPNGGLLILQSPLGRESINPVSTAVQKAIGLRCTAQQAVNVIGYAEISEGGS